MLTEEQWREKLEAGMRRAGFVEEVARMLAERDHELAWCRQELRTSQPALGRKGVAAELLEEALALVGDPERWTTGWFARDAQGDEVSPLDPGACRWCVLGALERCSRGYEVLAILEAKRLLWEASSGRSPAIVNDGGGHEAVMEVVRLAIARARAAQPQGVGNA